MKYARIQNGVVMEIVETDKDISTLYTPDLVWVACNDSVTQRQLYANGEFLPEPDVEVVEMPAPKSLTEMILESPTELAKLKAALGL
jgi:hypothetical protein